MIFLSAYRKADIIVRHRQHRNKRIVGCLLSLVLALGQVSAGFNQVWAQEDVVTQEEEDASAEDLTEAGDETAASEDEIDNEGAETPGDATDENISDVIDPSEIYSEELLQYIPKVVDYISYLDYLADHEQTPRAEDVIDIDLSTVTVEEMDDFSDINGELQTTGRGSIEFAFEVSESAMYELEIEYYQLEGSGTAIERSIMINGEVPFDEADRVLFNRIYKDKDQDYKSETANQSFPSQVEAPSWQTVRVKDQNGYFVEPLRFYLEEGENTLTIDSVKEPMAIRRISFVPSRSIPSYEEYISEHKANGAEVIVSSDIPYVQGEDALYKSTTSLYPLNDRTSPATIPYHYTYVRMNTIGGQSWDSAGEWLEWEVDVEEAGLYRLAMRVKQDLSTGIFSTRSLTVNGTVPFEEAASMQFAFNTAWQSYELQNENNESMLIYLDEGVNTLRLDVSLDAFSTLIYEVEEISSALNGIAQDIVVITSTTPDPYRDYQLVQRLPHMLPTLREELASLDDVIARMREATGGTSDKTAALDKTALQLREMVDNPNDIAKDLTSLQNNITALGNWGLTIKSQSLTIDYIALLGTEDPAPVARASFFANLKHEIMAFIGSFTNDYSQLTVGEGGEDAKTINVWVTTGRDQMDVIRRLLNESFDENVNVNLRLVSSSVALSATAAGRGPDVLIQTDSSQPIDFAFRESALDLTQFDDFEAAAEMVHPSALEAFEFEGGYYALPDQMSFPVLFYRADILSELQIPVPQTWEDIITIVPFLQNNNMEFFMEVATAATLGTATQATTKAVNSIYLSMLYQNGGELYTEDGTRALTDSPESLAVFEDWTDYYTKHSFPVALDFVTRFRLGSVPLAIVNFTNYTTLSVGAPEIRGDWGIAPIPGTRLEDGTIDRALPAVTSAAMIVRPMVEANDNKDAAWSFLKWWVSGDTQTSYATEMESLLGSSARYPVANLEAFAKSPWPTDAMDVLMASLNDLREIRQVPGSYITGRNVENAFYEVVNDPEDSNIRRSMIEWTENTNYEITSKRQEFGLDIYEGEQ